MTSQNARGCGGHDCPEERGARPCLYFDSVSEMARCLPAPTMKPTDVVGSTFRQIGVQKPQGVDTKIAVFMLQFSAIG